MGDMRITLTAYAAAFNPFFIEQKGDSMISKTIGLSFAELKKEYEKYIGTDAMTQWQLKLIDPFTGEDLTHRSSSHRFKFAVNFQPVQVEQRNDSMVQQTNASYKRLGLSDEILRFKVSAHPFIEAP